MKLEDIFLLYQDNNFILNLVMMIGTTMKN